jgi:putative multicomponent Na+:H+ antiporter subunit B
MFWPIVPAAEVAMSDVYLYAIVALLPLSACMLVLQVNPYHALVIRGILGAVAALVYAVLGAADVALTEALVGTMLAITLYAVTVRSSLIMRLGVLENWMPSTEYETEEETDTARESQSRLEKVIDDLRTVLGKHHLRLELVTYSDARMLHQALIEEEIHGICVQRIKLEQSDTSFEAEGYEPPSIQIIIRIRRLFEIMKTEYSSSTTVLTYVQTSDDGAQTVQTTTPGETHP